MQILYGYSNCTDKKYNEIFKDKNVAVLQPDQKYHGLLIKGLAKHDVIVKCFSGLPINRAVTNKKWISEADEEEKGVHYHYYTTLNLPIIRQLMIFAGGFVNVIRTKKDKNTYVICDCLNIANSYGMALACKIRKIPIVTIVTDLPDMLSGNSLIHKINNKIFGLFDAFVLLTEQMNEKVNKNQKPYIVLEGHVDSELRATNIDEKYEELSGKKVIVYAGSIQKLYGIQNLVEGFLKAEIPDAELNVFGDGDYREELLQIAREHNNIKYMGICSNEEVVKHEQRAMLLVNPRPIAPEYTKYSFPSKNMEYMASGTPLLTAKLPGMPKEYYPYVYLIEDESPKGIADILQKISKEEFKVRHEKGTCARRFVLEHKSNVAQAKKIICFMKEKLR